MPRTGPDPREELLDSAQCAERLGIHESDWWKVLERPDAEVLRRARRCLGARVRWLASALAKFMHALPSEPTRRPPSAGRFARKQEQDAEVAA